MAKLSKKTKWYPDTYKEGEEIDIVNLIEDDIKTRESQAIFDKKHWKWKYKKNNAGFYPNWIKLAKSKNDDFIGGHYTAIPVLLKANKKIVLSAQSVDTLTHKTLRRQGVFTKLAGLCYDELISDNTDIIYGYPNDNSYPGFVKKLKWKHIFTVYELGYILDVSKLVNFKFKGGIKNFISKIVLNTIFKSRQLINQISNDKSFTFDEISINNIDTLIVDEIISENHNYYLDRSMDYLKWRYLDNPTDKEIYVSRITIENKIVGYYIIKYKIYPHRNNIKIAHVMELILNTGIKNIYSSVLKNIIQISRKKKAAIIYTYSHDKQFDYRQYKRFGFIKLDNKNFIVRVFKNEEKYEGIFEASKWFISQGDSDRA